MFEGIYAFKSVNMITSIQHLGNNKICCSSSRDTSSQFFDMVVWDRVCFKRRKHFEAASQQPGCCRDALWHFHTWSSSEEVHQKYPIEIRASSGGAWPTMLSFSSLNQSNWLMYLSEKVYVESWNKFHTWYISAYALLLWNIIMERHEKLAKIWICFPDSCAVPPKRENSKGSTSLGFRFEECKRSVFLTNKPLCAPPVWPPPPAPPPLWQCGYVWSWDAVL